MPQEEEEQQSLTILNTGKENEVFDSLDSLIAASNSLMPPFKTVRLQDEPFLHNKVYTQSQTILVGKEELTQ